MAQIVVSNLTFSYEGSANYVFENVNFVVDTNWKLGFIGRNGRGKTTFLNLLQKKYEYKGNIQTSINFTYFPYEVKNTNKLTIDVVEEIYSNYELWKVIKNLHELNLSEDCLYKPFSVLSNGEQTKLMLAVMFTKENNFLLIDEPTNHLDYHARKCVCEFLKNQRGFIVVSHDRKFVDSCVDHILSINKCNIEVQKGNFSTWFENKQNQDEFEIKQNEKLSKDIEHLKASVEKTKQWAIAVEKTKNGTRDSGVKVDKGYVTHKAAKMMQRSKAIEVRQTKAIEEKSKLLKNIEYEDELFFFNHNSRLKGEILNLKNVSVKYGEKVVNKPISFGVENGQKVALFGKNGSGKTSLLKLVMGNNICFEGSVYKHPKLKISYVSQSFDGLCGTLENYAIENGVDKTMFFTLLIKFGLTRSQLEGDIQNFSAGQKKKVMLAKSLCEDADLYVWDEPLNYVDIISRMQIEKVLKNTNLTMIFVEHDMAFVENVANKVVELS